MAPPSFHPDDLRDRARAAFLGLALGDALGATVEFMTAAEIRAQYGRHREIVGGGWLHLKRGKVTDDTEMSVRIARAIDETGGWSLRAVADQLAAWLKARPTDVGSTCRRGIRNYILDGTLETPRREWDAGNGAAMRMLPVALFALGDEAMLDRCALEQAHLTHNHPLSDAACACIGRLVQLAVRGCSLAQLRRVADALVAKHPTFRFEGRNLLSTGYVVDTMQTVLHAFFSTRSFEQCLVETVNLGGDADTAGAIAGMIAGAYYGPRDLPRRWLKRLDPALARELTELSERLVELSPLVRGSGAPGR